MVSLNCISISKLNISASSLPNNKTSSPSSSRPDPSLHSLNTATPVQTPPQTLRKPRQKLEKKQPSVVEIERAIGAGFNRDREPEGESEEKESLFETIFARTIGKTEGRVEKQLRETGEWINDKTERKLRSAGKPILVFMYQWVLPMWILAFCIASGIIKLPFHNAFLDDLLM